MTNVGAIDAAVSRWLTSMKITAHLYRGHPRGGTATQTLMLSNAMPSAPAAMLRDVKGIGPEFAALLWSEGLFRHFDNRRQVAGDATLTSGQRLAV